MRGLGAQLENEESRRAALQSELQSQAGQLAEQRVTDKQREHELEKLCDELKQAQEHLRQAKEWVWFQPFTHKLTLRCLFPPELFYA